MHDTSREMRKFGLVVGGVFAGIGAYVLWRAGAATLGARICGGLGGALVLAGLLCPRALLPVHRFWMALAHVLGWVNTRLILSAVFYTGFVLARAYLWLRREDPMARRPAPALATYWSDVRTRPAGRKSYEHPF
jgi:hypothetical protein